MEREKVELELMKEILDRGNELHFKAFGNSMLPFIRPGDVLTIKPVKPEDINIGDVILYQVDNNVIAHRLIKKTIKNNESIFLTRGDFVPHPDIPIKSSQILGKVVELQRENCAINLETSKRKIMANLIAKNNSIIYIFLNYIIKIIRIFR